MVEWCRLRCLELLLWIAEVFGQDKKVDTVVNQLLEDTRCEVNDGKARNEMLRDIKAMIKWQDIMDYIEDKGQSKGFWFNIFTRISATSTNIVGGADA